MVVDPVVEVAGVRTTLVVAAVATEVQITTPICVRGINYLEVVVVVVVVKISMDMDIIMGMGMEVSMDGMG